MLVPAACAWGLARAPKVRALETAAVPAERLAAALGEAKKADGGRDGGGQGCGIKVFFPTSVIQGIILFTSAVGL